MTLADTIFGHALRVGRHVDPQFRRMLAEEAALWQRADLAVPLLGELEAELSSSQFLAALATTWALLGREEEVRRLAARSSDQPGLLALAWARLGDDARADSLLLESDRLYPELPFALGLVSDACRVGRWRRAIELLRRVSAERSPNQVAGAWIRVAKAAEAEDSASAVECLGEAERVASAIPSASGSEVPGALWVEIALAHAEAGRMDDARRLAERAQALARAEPGHHYFDDWHCQLAGVFRVLGDDAVVENILDGYDAVIADGKLGWVSRARCRALSGDSEEAWSVVQRGLRQPKSTGWSDRAYTKLVTIALGAAEPAEALRWAIQIQDSEEQVDKLLEIARWCRKQGVESDFEIEAILQSLPSLDEK